MKKVIKNLICIIIMSAMVIPSYVFAWEGDCGYEGGISSGLIPNKTTFDYKEMCFVSGEPIVMSGTLTLKKSLSKNTVASTYTYSLSNKDKSATLVRTLTYNTLMTKKANGQTVEDTTQGKTTSEVIKIGSTTYTMTNYNFTRTNLVDPKPGINYYAGNTWGKKTYMIGTSPGTGTLTVEGTGNFYGYDQYWGSTEVQTINYVISYLPTASTSSTSTTTADKWGGTAAVSLSFSTSKELKYVENQPDQISFDGGYVQTQDNQGILEYSSKLPEFDSSGISTDNMITKHDSLSLQAFPSQSRLPVANISQIKGHWAQTDIETLYSLEVFSGNESSFDPEQFMTRQEFAQALVRAAKEVPTDPSLASKTNTKSNTKTPTVMPFDDVTKDSAYFNDILSAYNRGLFVGKGDYKFRPADTLTVAEALTAFIRALGLESLAPGPNAVTTFKDNDQIPDFARNSIYVASNIGLALGDEKGNIKPNDKLTKARAAAFIDRFINYMRSGIIKDYKEKIINY